jgi:hypothetical protein
MTPEVAQILHRHSTELVQIVDASRRIVYQNEAFEKLRLAAGLEPDNPSAGLLVHPDDCERAAS